MHVMIIDAGSPVKLYGRPEGYSEGIVLSIELGRHARNEPPKPVYLVQTANGRTLRCERTEVTATMESVIMHLEYGDLTS
jgi:hypothetical protein